MPSAPGRAAGGGPALAEQENPAAMTPAKKPGSRLARLEAAMPAQTVTSAMTVAEAMACPGRLVKDRAAAAADQPGLPGHHRCSVETLAVTALSRAFTSASIQDW